MKIGNVDVKLGDLIMFRYQSPKHANKSQSGATAPRMILVLAPGYEGNLHGIRVDALTTTQQEFLSNVFYVLYTNQGNTNIFEPIEAQVNFYKSQLDVLAKRDKDLLMQGKAVVMRPGDPNNPVEGDAPAMSSAPLMRRRGGKATLGSVVGKVSTFGKTQVTSTQRMQEDPMIQSQINTNQKMMEEKKRMLDYYTNLLMQNKAMFQSIPKVSDNPYVFYHQFFKTFINSREFMPQIYRKFALPGIKSPRIIKLAGNVPLTRTGA